MIRKQMMLWSIAVLLTIGFVAPGFVSLVPAKTVELTFQHFLPPVGLMSDQYREWGKLVEKRTEGRVKIKWLWSNSLFSMTEVLQSVNAGLADLGIASGAYFPSQLPTVLGFEHAYNASDVWVGMRATSNLVFKRMPEIQQEFKANGVIAAMPYGSGTFQWFVKGKWDSSNSFRGKVGRTMGGGRKVFYEKLGMKPVFLSVTDIYEAVERGTVWGFDNTLNLSNDLKLYEVLDRVALLNSGVVMSAYTVMNLKKFNALSKSDQQTLLDAGIDWAENMMAKALVEREAVLVKEWKEKRNVNIVYPTAEDLAKMKKIGRDAGMELAKQQDAKTGPKGNAVKAIKMLWEEVDLAEKELKEKGYPWSR